VRVLIVKLGSIGDIIHTLPALAEIRREMPNSEISWVVEKRSAEILRGNSAIDRLIEIDTKNFRSNGSGDAVLRNLRGQVGELRKGKFDTAIDFQGLIKSAVVAKLSGAKKRWGFAGRALREPASRIFLTDTVKIARRTHVIRKNLLLARTAVGLGSVDGSLKFPITVAPADVDEADAIIERVGPRFAILNPGGGWVTKLWDARKFGQLADRLWAEFRLPSVIVSGPNEDELARLAFESAKSGKVLSTEPSLKGFFELSKHATVYVGGDTGPTHLAIAAGAPVVGLFGPTEWWRNGSLDPADICVERNDIGCRVACHRRTCSNWICMDISVETVLDAVRKRISAEAALI
jgi:lipopolysaccharide heptosyltransferase I